MLYYGFIVLAKFCFCLATSEFYEPKEAIDTQEIYQYLTDDEFIINNYAVTWSQANYICKHTHRGSLAYFENQEVIDFLGEYLGNSDLSVNTLWVNLRKKKIFDRQWKTLNDKAVNNSIFECQYHAPINFCLNCTESKNCGAVVRMYHSKLCFVKLNCDARRKFICRRSITEKDKSTHLDWIKIGSKLFKIFYERLSYDRAAEACAMHDIDARLAFIETYHEAQTLGRFLLIGRPSKERVWIGGRWDYNSYEFQEEFFVLSNTTEASGYPPWLRGKMTKPYGCLLLDRHLSNKTYFVESRCDRFHAYMCYKRDKSPPFVNVCLEGNYDWRIYYTAQDWFKAAETCRKSVSTGRLPYITFDDLKSITHVMETSKFDVLYHVWLGAYFKNDVWIWTYNNRRLHEKTDSLPFLKNKTYNARIEKLYTCLNLDREVSLEIIFYGTNCYYPQYFICQYDKSVICNNKTIFTTTSSVPIKGITTDPLSNAPSTTPPTTTPPTTTPPTTTTTRIIKPNQTTVAREIQKNHSVMHTTEFIWIKSQNLPARTTPIRKVTVKEKNYRRDRPKHRGENSPKRFTRNIKNIMKFRITTNWPSNDHDYIEDHANLDYLIFN